MEGSRNIILSICGLIAVLLLFFALLLTGSVDIPASDVWEVLATGTSPRPYIATIVLQTRLPMAVAAACCGATLSVAGVMMQTLFRNPLAGPSVLGISSGSSFAVAMLMLCFGGAGALNLGDFQPLCTTFFALAGGLLTIAVLNVFSSIIKSAVTLLIVGLMLSYLFSSGISLLNYFSKAEELKSYYMWGLGSFTGLRLKDAIWFAALAAVAIIPTILYIKPLNALLIGERYAESVGFSVKGIRGGILFLTGVLVAVATAFCGPIGFLGLIVPHLVRMLYRTSNHLTVLPGCILFGAVTGLLCALLGVLPAAKFGVLPVNVITPIIGVPVILYLVIRRR